MRVRGALQVAFRDSDGPYRERGRLMLAGSVIAGFAVCIGSLGGNHAAVAVPLAVAWAFATGMLVCLGQAAGDLGLMSLVLLVIYEAVPMPPERAMLSGLAAMAGGVFQTALAVANWHRSVWAHQTGARRPVSGVGACAGRAGAGRRFAARHGADYRGLQCAAGARRGPDPGGGTAPFLLSQAERMRLSLLALRRTRARLERDVLRQRLARRDRFIADASRITLMIGHALKSGGDLAASAKDVAGISAFADQMRAHLSAMVDDGGCRWTRWPASCGRRRT